MKISSGNLHRLLHNAQLFTQLDSSNKGYAFFCTTLGDEQGGALHVLATDDVVCLRDSVYGLDVDGTERFMLKRKDLVNWERSLREAHTEMDLSRGNLDLMMEFETNLSDDTLDYWFDVETVINYFIPTDHTGPIAISPARLKKFSQLVFPMNSDKDGFPLDLVFGTVFEDVQVGWKCGPTATGLISPLDRDTLSERYDSRHRGVLW